jgi:hypothetical protein
MKFFYKTVKRGRSIHQSHCKDCMRTAANRYNDEQPARRMLTRAKRRAKDCGMAFDLVDADILPLPTHCPVFGLELQAAAVPRDFRAYSLDRVDNTKGYVRGNVAVISYLANRLKNDGTAEEHEQIAAWMRLQGQS